MYLRGPSFQSGWPLLFKFLSTKNEEFLHILSGAYFDVCEGKLQRFVLF